MSFFVNTHARWFCCGRYDLRETGYGLVYYVSVFGFCLNLQIACSQKKPGAGTEA